MKQFIVGLLMALGVLPAIAQVKEGTIVYERKINMHRTITDEQMRAMIPEFRISRHMLLCSDSISLFRLIPEDEAPDPFAGYGGARMMIRIGGSDGGELYKNFSQEKSIQSSELGGKTYLVMDPIKQQPWKLVNETKQILGYQCLKATRKITVPATAVRRMMVVGGGPAVADTAKPQPREIELVAWYTESIPCPAGPENYGQLPGVILQLDSDNGASVFTATEIKKTLDLKELKEPKKGKQVTTAEFNKIRADLLQQQLQGGGSGFRFSN